MELQSLLSVQRRPIDQVIAGLRDGSDSVSKDAGLRLLKEAGKVGLSVRDYLTLAVEPDANSEGLNGYERTLEALNLPIRQDLSEGVVLQAASETFQTFPGTRALFPEVVDDVVRWSSRQTLFETVAPMLLGSRTTQGTELLSTVVDDDSAERDSFSVPEGARIPVRSIRTSQKTVTFFKHGSGIRSTYEFGRRASLELMVPYLNRIARELELGKVTAATAVLINGDGNAGAAPEVDQSSYNTATGQTATAGVISWYHLVYWLIQRAKAGTPVDTVVMNWDGWFQWQMLFAKPIVHAPGTSGDGVAVSRPAIDNIGAMGVQLQQQAAALNLSVTPVLSSAVPANKLIGITKGETLEELVEAGSMIEETERAVLNQTITMVKTETTGYRLPWADTRSVFDFGN